MWGNILGANYPNELPVLFDRLAAVMALPEQARQELRALGETDELYMEPLASADNAFAGLHLTSSNGTFTPLVTDRMLYGLLVCSKVLHDHRPKPLPDADTLDRLLHEAEELVRDVLDADIDEELRTLLVDHLQSMIGAMQTYRIRGREALEAAVDRAVGNLVRRPDLHPAVQKSSLGTRFSKLLAGLVLALTAWNSTFDAIGNVAALTAGSPSTEQEKGPSAPPSTLPPAGGP